MSFIDLFKEFHGDATEREFPPSARVMYDQLLYEFNARYWKEELLMSERELSRLSGLTPATTHRAIQFLCENGYLKTKKAKRRTIFKLSSDKVPVHEAIANQQRSEDEATAERARNDFENSNIRTRKDVEDSRGKDSYCSRIGRGEKKENSRNGENFWNVEAEERLTTLWVDNCGAGVTFELLSYLKFIVEKHGVSFAEELIREMAGGLKGDRMTLNYLRGCYKRKTEGGTPHGQQTPKTITYTLPKYKGDEPWLNFTPDPSKRKVKPFW